MWTILIGNITADFQRSGPYLKEESEEVVEKARGKNNKLVS